MQIRGVPVLNFLRILFVFFVSSNILAAEQTENVLDARNQQEKQSLDNNFSVTLYKPNYILPFYYTASPYDAVYKNETPSDEELNSSEIKYQLSFKIPIFTHLFYTPTNLFFGYTQLSYWQLYNKKAFFRSTDYEPEIFTSTTLNLPLGEKWAFHSFRLGAVHQSNGFGNEMERSWNRVYFELAAAGEHGSLSVRPWYVFQDATYKKYNPDMAKYLGYGEIILAYKFEKPVVSLQTHGLVEHGGRYATGTLNISYPLNKYINGFVQFFSGYGQSLIEYNHHTNSIGCGFSLNNFI